jgi:exopolyphosphatase/guanosine-5'-triphosphate,3'-diphosphate pyrophosphatase
LNIMRAPAGVGATQAQDEVAAVDLGSNSFHMMVARENGGQLQVIDRLREAVRLAAGLGEDRRLSAQAQARALACLERFGQRLAGLPPQRVRAVGTNTLRRLQDGGAFVSKAQKALGHEIEVISGVEEARLVYSGVTHGMGRNQQRRLVVDIGGGSTELIIGRRSEPRLMESVPLGCVLHTQRFFADGEITRSRMREARLAARVELEFLERPYRAAGWDVAIGASGTVRGTWRVMMAQGWTDEFITRQALEKTLELVIKAGRVERIDFPGLREDRRPVFAGGIAVLAGVFDGLGIQSMETSEHALREGVIYDLVGRLSDQDVRSRSVEAMAERYGVDRVHAHDVERSALRLLDQARTWRLERTVATRLLSWAALLHEIGLVVAHDGSHRHGEYILRNADLYGFSQTDQKLLAALVRLQRGKFANGALEDIPDSWQEPIRKLAVLFRLAIVLHRSRTPGLRVRFQLQVSGRNLRLRFPTRWLDRHPLTREDLEREADWLEPAGFKLKSS